MSLFMSDIGLQFAKSFLIPLLYRSIIRAKYCEYVSWLLSNPLINIYEIPSPIIYQNPL